nr:MAG TPA: hypothetical protein [Caudoviricetes sp.]
MNLTGSASASYETLSVVCHPHYLHFVFPAVCIWQFYHMGSALSRPIKNGRKTAIVVLKNCVSLQRNSPL